MQECLKEAQHKQDLVAQQRAFEGTQSAKRAEASYKPGRGTDMQERLRQLASGMEAA